MLFDKIETLDHPRFIMQYRKKKIDSYISQYITAFDRSINHE